MTQPKELDIAEIEKVLEAATPGPWKMDLWPRTDAIGIQQHGSITDYVALMSRSNKNHHNDAYLIANAPEWLRTLLELLRYEKVQSSGWNSEYLKVVADLQQTREELERSKETISAKTITIEVLVGQVEDETRLHAKTCVELEQVKAERDGLREDLFYEKRVSDECHGNYIEQYNANESLRTELSAKDEVFTRLKQIENEIGRYESDKASFVGQRVTKLYEEMQSILQQYTNRTDSIPDKSNGPITMQKNRDGNDQLRDNLSGMWCACGEPAIHYDSELESPYDFQCEVHRTDKGEDTDAPK